MIASTTRHVCVRDLKNIAVFFRPQKRAEDRCEMKGSIENAVDVQLQI